MATGQHVARQLRCTTAKDRKAHPERKWIAEEAEKEGGEGGPGEACQTRIGTTPPRAASETHREALEVKQP